MLICETPQATTEYLAYLEEAIKVYRSAGSDSIIHSPPTFSASESGPGDELADFDEDEEDEEVDEIAIESMETSPMLQPLPPHHNSILGLTDTEATHALLLLADHQHSPYQGPIGGKSKPISVKDLLL